MNRMLSIVAFVSLVTFGVLIFLVGSWAALRGGIRVSQLTVIDTIGGGL